MNIDNRQFLSINQLADTYLQGTQKVQSASELMTNCPSEVDKQQLDELHISIVPVEE